MLWFLVYEFACGDLFCGSSRAYEPSSFFRIRYTMNITTKMANKSPTTAPPMTAIKKMSLKKVLTKISLFYHTSKNSWLSKEARCSILVRRIHNQHIIWATVWCFSRREWNVVGRSVIKRIGSSTWVLFFWSRVDATSNCGAKSLVYGEKRVIISKRT